MVLNIAYAYFFCSKNSVGSLKADSRDAKSKKERKPLPFLLTMRLEVLKALQDIDSTAVETFWTRNRLIDLIVAYGDNANFQVRDVKPVRLKF